MGNIPVPFSVVPGNVGTKPIEKRLFLFKMFSLSACIVGTAAFIRPIDRYFAAEYFGIVVPALMTGYILINSSEILATYMGESHIFLEVCFAAIGSFGCILCCLYQFPIGIDWSMIFTNNTDKNLGQGSNTRRLIVFLACLINSIALLLVVIVRGIEEEDLSRISTD